MTFHSRQSLFHVVFVDAIQPVSLVLVSATLYPTIVAFTSEYSLISSSMSPNISCEQLIFSLKIQNELGQENHLNFNQGLYHQCQKPLWSLFSHNVGVLVLCFQKTTAVVSYTTCKRFFCPFCDCIACYTLFRVSHFKKLNIETNTE